MITQLKNRALLKLSGKDVQGFLQGQFSNDINALNDSQIQLNAYCQHQGKIIALIWVMKKKADYYLSFPSDLADVVIKRLSMFKMMSDVNITDVSDEIIQLGLLDGNGQDLVDFKFNAQQSIALVDSVEGIELANFNNWELACIENGLPEVHAKTSEMFAPQLLNLDIDEMGVSFTKGCYPGQEVVARLHYLGKSKRRMRAFQSDATLQVGDELMVKDSKSIKASGLIVRQVRIDDISYCLATIEIAHENSHIALNSPDGAMLTLMND